MKQELFKVVNEDHAYIVYTNGEISGFPENSWVCNWYPALVREEVLKQKEPSNAIR